jgi:hypothetical protein
MLKSFRVLYLVVLVLGPHASAQDHAHLNVGAAAQLEGKRLTFDNGADFTPESGYVKTLTYTNAGKFASLFQGNITLTVLHSANAFGEPVPNAPAPGTFVVAEIVSASGPAGGRFQFWETNSTTEAAFDIPTGTSEASYRFELSEAALGAGEPGGDAFGHIHGRRFSATKPGLYTVGFRALDVSTNGTAGGAIHIASDVLLVNFQAGINLLSVVIDSGMAHIRVAAPAGYVWQLEAKNQLSDLTWAPIGTPWEGSDKMIEIPDAQPAAVGRIYRANGTALPP